MKQPQKRLPKIVGHGIGPHIYANEMASVFFDGFCVTITFGTLEVRFSEKDTPNPELPVIGVTGKVTLTPAAAAATVQALTNALNAVAGHHQQKGPHSPVMN